MEEERLRKQGRRELSLCAAGDAGDGRGGKELLLTCGSSRGWLKVSVLPCGHLHSSSLQTLLLSCGL